MQNSQTSISAKVTTLVFVLFFFGGAIINVFWPFHEFSFSENRYLAKFPVFSWSSLVAGEFTSDFETYLTDQFPLRDFWVSVKSDSERFSQKKENNGVYFGKENSLIERFDFPDMEKSHKQMSYLAQFEQRIDLPIHLAWIPTAAEIQKTKLPAFASPYSQEIYVQDLLKDQIDPNTLLGPEIWAGLRQHSEEQLYFNSDHHWTALGAFRFYQSLMPILGYSALEESAYQKDIVSSNFLGTLDAKAGGGHAHADSIERWTRIADANSLPSYEVLIPDINHEGSSFFFPQRLEEKDQYTYYLDGNHAITVLRNLQLPKGKHLLLIKDSFSHVLAPFLAQHYGEIHLLDLRYYNRDVDEYLLEHNFDEILILYSTRQFAVDNHLFKLAD